MGFELSDRSVTLQFDGGPADGATVKVRSMSIRELIAVRRLSQTEGLEGYEDVLRTFGENVLESWDITMRGEPIAANGDGMCMIPMDVANAIVSAWNRWISGDEGNSDAASESGAILEAASA